MPKIKAMVKQDLSCLLREPDRILSAPNADEAYLRSHVETCTIWRNLAAMGGLSPLTRGSQQ